MPNIYDEEWVCEAHPDKPFQHDGCRGAGMLSDESCARLRQVAAHVEAGEMPANEADDARDLWFAEWQLVLPKDAREAWPGGQSADGVREPVEAQQCNASAQRVWWCHEGSLGRPRCEWQCPVCEGDDNDEAAPAGVGPVDGGQR